MSFQAAQRLASDFHSNPLARFLMHRPGDRGGAAPFQREMYQGQHLKSATIACNGIGKTYGGAGRAWRCLMGRDPNIKPGGVNGTGILGWVLCSDLTEGWPTVSAALHALAPPGAIDPACTYDEVTGYQYKQKKALKLSEAWGGSLLVGKGCENNPLSLEGRNIDFAWVDEPPKRAHFNGLRARLRRIDGPPGPIWVTMTPIGRPCAWLRYLIEGDPDDPLHAEPIEPDWHVEHIPLEPHHAPHRTQESIDAQITTTDPMERAQRILAEWEGVAQGRVLVGFSESTLCHDEDIDALDGIQSIDLSWDHGTRQGAEVCYLLLWDGWAVWVADEYVSPPGPLLPIDHARTVTRALKGWGLHPHHITRSVGDNNSAGFLGPGRLVNDELMQAFCQLTGMQRPPFTIETPNKRPGSVAHRRRLMNNAMLSGRFYINADRCPSLIKTCRYWEGQDNDLKHVFDAVMYGAEAHLEKTIQVPGPRKITRR